MLTLKDVNLVGKMPDSGDNFIAIWKHEGQLWSTAVRLRSGVLEEYKESSDEFVPCSYRTIMHLINDVSAVFVAQV